MSRGMNDRRLNKALGQHFLTRSEVCTPLIEFLRPEGCWVTEIGPGSGALTAALLDAGARVVAWELDPRWAFRVQSHFGRRGLSTVLGDGLELPWQSLPPGSVVAGNLPFNVATRIILEMLESTLAAPGRIVRAGFLVQREVAERLVAEPGGKAYGSLSVLVAMLARARRLATVAPGAFRPPPKVDSAFVGLTPRSEVLDPASYARAKTLVRSAFAQRRKTLRNSLAASLGVERAEALLEAAGLDRLERAEALGPKEFSALLECLEGLESGT